LEPVQPVDGLDSEGLAKHNTVLQGHKYRAVRLILTFMRWQETNALQT